MPAPEYCFLWIDWWPMCMTKAEWSGWMQALGAVVAICAAIWIARSGERLRRIEAVDAAEVAAVLLMADLHMLTAAVKKAEVAFREATELNGNWLLFVESSNAIARLGDLAPDQILRVTSASPDVASDVARLAVLMFRLRASTGSLEWLQNGLDPRQMTLKKTVHENLKDLQRETAKCSTSLGAFSTLRSAARRGTQAEKVRWSRANPLTKVRILFGRA